MAVVLVVAGVAIVAIAVFDIFATILNPEDEGWITTWIAWTVWRVIQLLPIQLMTYAGPLAYVAVLVSWTLLLVTGGALIYWPFIPDAFAFDSGIPEDHRSGLLTAFYLSFVTFSTLGYGDITPTEGWLRVVGPLQTLIGFFLLSAAITWILAIYQDIERRRTLAHETTLLHQALDNGQIKLSELQAEVIEKLVDQVTTRFVNVTGSLNQFPITYFFRISDERQSLAIMSLFLAEICEELEQESVPAEVRLRARMLSGALDDFAESLRTKFVNVGPDATTQDVLEAYARDHRRHLSDVDESE